MKPFIIEIAIMIILMLLLIFIGFTCKKHSSSHLMIYMVTLGLVEVYFIIHILFCFEIGFPASAIQNSIGEYALKPEDWLNFLGSYLGFAGAFVMAYLVYRQSRIIDMLTLSEYMPSLRIKLCKCTNDGAFINGSIIQRISDDSDEPYYTYRLMAEVDSSTELEEFGILMFFEIINDSKTIVEGIDLLSVAIKELKSKNEKVRYYVQEDEWNPIGQSTKIFPGHKVKRCIYIEKIPKKIDLGRMTMTFKYDNAQNFCPEIFVSKQAGKILAVFINESEPK